MPENETKLPARGGPGQWRVREEVVIKFAGDSGDGMQLTGGQFTNTAALVGNDLATFPDYPAEIRAPVGTLAGVSGFQISFASRPVFTPGDNCDVLVAMNAAALKANLDVLVPGGELILNSDGFDDKNLRLAGYASNPLEDDSLAGYTCHVMDVTRMTRETLKDTPLSTKEKDRCKNMFVLGFLYWMYDRPLDSTLASLQAKFSNKPELYDANAAVLRAGYHYGDTTETFSTRYKVEPARMPPGRYRSITGNDAIGLGLVAASVRSGLPLFLGSYPITPASDILHYLAGQKAFGVRTFQAEDEIAAICAAIGASFGGSLAVTTTSGPGMALKTEAMGLAVMLELPLLIIDVQRAGPSTGMPTKTEQSDLLQAVYGRNGECPLVVMAAHSPSDAFETAYEACRVAVEHMTPVILLSDGYIANGAEPWRYPHSSELSPIRPRFAGPDDLENGAFHPYQRDERLVRKWAVPGIPGLEHRIGGLEKQDITGNISYDPTNHEFMVKLREAKVEKVAEFLPDLVVDQGPEQGDLLVLGWGSTFGACRAAVRDLCADGHSVAHAHLRHIRPLPRNLGQLMDRYRMIMVPEINNGQLVRVLRDRFPRAYHPFNRIQGLPLKKGELMQYALELLASK
jgi:2-oxoglutarate/2-oxoacid ferredoxin oxidoreductase subunit alpha